jgi:NitT/TauT family transport system substrate-binding protein
MKHPRSRAALRRLLVVPLAVLLVVSGGGAAHADQSGSPAASPVASAPVISSAPMPPMAVRFALQPNLNAVNFWVALENGYFEQNGILAEIIPVDIGFNGVQLAVTGEVQGGGSSTYPMLNIYAGGGNQIVPAVYAVVTIQKIVAGNDIQTPQDFAGKRVAITQGSIFEYSFTKYLLDHGVDPASVEIVPVDAPEQPAALARGDVDAIVNVDPLASQALEALGDEGHLVEPGIDFRDRVYLQMNRDWVTANPDAVVAILRSLVEASDFVESNPTEAWAIVAENLGIEPEAVQAQVQAGWEFDVTLGQDAIDETQRTAEFMLERGILTEPVDVPAIFDGSYLRQVDPSLVTIDE